MRSVGGFPDREVRLSELRVQSGKVDAPAQERAGAANQPPMRWAVRESIGQAVSILQLARRETGLACQCICPTCSSPLQAVNAGVGPEHFERKNARGQFFWHQTGQQRETCRLIIARLAALQLRIDISVLDDSSQPQRACIDVYTPKLQRLYTL